MRFELEPDNFNQPDEDLLADLRRVVALVQPARITKELYNKYGRWCAATMRKRFGNWNDALHRAGIQPTRQINISSEDLILDIRPVAATLVTATLSLPQYKTLGKYSQPTMLKNFGSWSAAVRAAGLTPAYELPVDVTDELCFEAIASVWRRVGRQPRQSDVKTPDVKVSAQTITRWFGSWRKALEAFVAFVNKADDTNPPDAKIETAARNDQPTTGATTVPKSSTPRAPGWKLRYLVMYRDDFQCCKCGARKGDPPGTKLVLDHILAWSNGGTTIFENLRTLCEVCNGGRGNLDLDD